MFVYFNIPNSKAYSILKTQRPFQNCSKGMNTVPMIHFKVTFDC